MGSCQESEVKIFKFESNSPNDLCASVDALLAKHASFVSHKAEMTSNRNDEDLNQRLLHEKEDAALIAARNSQNEQKLKRREVEDEGLERIGVSLRDQGAVSLVSTS
jgi:hypothetical protein